MRFLWILFLVGFAHTRYTPDLPEGIEEQYGLALDALLGMGIRLQSLLGKDDERNFVVSPLSATTMIAQLLLGAEGAFREELFDLLSLPKYSDNSSLSHYGKDKNETYSLPFSKLHLQLSSLLKTLQRDGVYTLKQKSALFIDDQLKLKKRFKEQLCTFYDTEIFPISSQDVRASQDLVNSWVEKQTRGLISKSVGLEPGTASLFMNAVYFLAEWESPFDNLLNNNSTFKITQNKSVETTYMMGNIERIKYSATPNYRLICMPYKKHELGMYIILPNENHPDKYNIRKFTEGLRANDVFASIKAAKVSDVIVKIPKLSLSTTTSILDHLKKYQQFNKQTTNQINKDKLEELHDENQHFGNFTVTQQNDLFLSGVIENGPPLKLSDVVQEMVFTINEKGTEAAAISSSILDYINSSEVFVVNRPFAFFIRHEGTKATLFWGTISNPTQH